MKDVADLHENGKGDGDGTDAQSITQVPQDSSQAESMSLLTELSILLG